MEWFKSVVIELRPKLQSANVFINLQTPKKVTSVNLQTNLVQLSLGGSCCKIDFPSGFKAVPSTLASVKVTENNVSFRFCTSAKLGSFKSELLNNPPPVQPPPNITVCRAGIEYSLNCTNCLKSLNSTVVKFDRVLPLPDSVDQSDWFCHAPNHNTNLEPTLTDLFFSPCFVHINRLNMANTLTKNGVFVCKYCFNWLGIQHASTTVKLWLNCTSFASAESHETNNKRTGLTDAFLAVSHSFNKLLNTTKIIFYLKNSEGTTNHLLLWIIEKQLDIVVTDQSGTKQTTVAKLLFRFIRDKDEDEILQTWFEDQSVELVDVSKNMMLEVLKHLYLHNHLFPDEFNKSNDFLISYLFMYE